MREGWERKMNGGAEAKGRVEGEEKRRELSVTTFSVFLVIRQEQKVRTQSGINCSQSFP